jgi:hypothetical protein
MMRRSFVVVVSVVAVLVGVATPAHAINPGPINLPALVGTVRDGCTGVKVPNLSVTVTRDPGPAQSPDKLAAGHFVFKTINPGPQQLQVSAPGYAALGDPAVPGVTVTIDPGPVNLPSPEQMVIGLSLPRARNLIYLSRGLVTFLYFSTLASFITPLQFIP